MPAAPGDVVRVTYSATLDDGTEFDSRDETNPLEFRLGEDQVIRGFEDAILGMEVGDRRRVTVPPDKAYGLEHPELVQEVSTELFDFPSKVGMRVGLVAEEDVRVEGLLTRIDGDKATIDLNHPLAGMSVSYDIVLVEIVDSVG